MSLSRLVSFTVFVALITACGQKGPLVLPDDDKPAQTSNGKAVSTKPAAKKQLDGDTLTGKPLSGKAITTKPLTSKAIDSKPMNTKPYNVE